MDLDHPDYNGEVDLFRETEYPMLREEVYLDHAGTTLYPKTLMERFSKDMISNLYGNPHSGSSSSQLSTSRIEETRVQVLRFFRADPQHFDVVFVANATAGAKLVLDGLRSGAGFSYRYHQDSHTSLVGIREGASESSCMNDEDVERWLAGLGQAEDGDDLKKLQLFAYPAQSNMDGRRLPLDWCARAKVSSDTACQQIYTLLDAAAFVATSQLDLSNQDSAPDFTVLSFNKIFGFPDLGALIVKKDSGTILRGRQYFGGGTVDMVLCIGEQWHAPKEQALHTSLEDGTLPMHSIMALASAIETHAELFQSMDKIAKHTAYLAEKLHRNLSALRHMNNVPVCQMYSRVSSHRENGAGNGPVVTFNLRNSHGAWSSNSEVEKLAAVKKIHIRTGGLCNPGGVMAALQLAPWEVRRNFSAGFRCGGDNDIQGGRPTGVIRASLGASSSMSDVDRFVEFIREFYVDSRSTLPMSVSPGRVNGNLMVESLTVYPIKSGGGYQIPKSTAWEVHREGLAWDREWCLIHQGTGNVLSQKKYPKMALLRPRIDLDCGLLKVRFHGVLPPGCMDEVSVPLSADPTVYHPSALTRSQPSRVCGELVNARAYTLAHVNEFFTSALGVSCVLARFPPGGSGMHIRHAKAHLQRHQQKAVIISSNATSTASYGGPPTPPDSDTEAQIRPILLSNESPILVITRESLTALNQMIEEKDGKPAAASVFRANIVVAAAHGKDGQRPYEEDDWFGLTIGSQDYRMLGACRRCHMVCVDQQTAEKDEEPFVTLSKTRRFDGKVFFGTHMCHVPKDDRTQMSQHPTIRVGDVVVRVMSDER